MRADRWVAYGRRRPFRAQIVKFSSGGFDWTPGVGPDQRAGSLDLTLQTLGNYRGCDGGVVMCPESEDRPSRRLQSAIRVTVSKPISLNLRAPPSRVRFRPGPVCRTAMPEAPVDENCHLCSKESDVRSTAGTRQRDVNSITQAESVQRRTQGDFARRVALSRSLHATANFGGGCLRSRRPLLLRSLLQGRAVPRHPRPT